MPASPGPHYLPKTRLILDPSFNATPKDDGPKFYEELGSEFGGFAGHVLISQHAFDEPWPTWEMHPHGDEFVYLLSGEVELLLKRGDAIEAVRMREPGTYVVVPKGAWHTARPLAPTVMLFVTPGEGTLNQGEPS